MDDRRKVTVGFVGAMIWAAIVLWIGTQIALPIFALVPVVMTAFFAPGCVLLLMIAVVSMRRCMGSEAISGQAFAVGSVADIDRRVLINTAEQLVLALCIWPGVAVLLAGNGPGVIAALSTGFVLARLVFWIGYRTSFLLRIFGFGATLFPTLLAALWALLELVL